MSRGQLPARLLPTHLTREDGPERLSGRNTIRRNAPPNIMSPTRSQPGPSAEVSLSVRGHHTSMVLARRLSSAPRSALTGATTAGNPRPYLLNTTRDPPRA